MSAPPRFAAPGLVALLRQGLRDLPRRPLFPLWALALVGNAFLLSRGQWILRSVDTSVGAGVAQVNGEFQLAFAFALMTFLLLGFPFALAAGTPLLRDRELRVEPLLHTTPLGPRSYVWGRFLSVYAGVVGLLLVHTLALMLWNHVLPDAGRPAQYGPLDLGKLLRPTLIFLLPAATLIAGGAVFLAALTRRTLVVFLLPTAAFLFFMQFFWSWFPEHHGPATVSLLQHLDPSGFRWLKQNWLIVDRGIDFYNREAIRYDPAFVLSRLAHAGLGLLLVAAAAAHVRRTLRAPDRVGWLGRLGRRIARRRRPRSASADDARAADRSSDASARPAMRVVRPGWLAVAGSTARVALSDLLRRPSLYLLMPVVAFFTLQTLQVETGLYGTAEIPSAGAAALRTLVPVQLWAALLLLVHVVRLREADTVHRLRDIVRASPASASARLVGQLLAALALAALLHVAAFVACALFLTATPGTALEIGPFLLIWIALGAPTILLWITAIMALFAVTGRRATATYGLALALLFATGWAFFTDHLNWVGNWALIGAPLWSDFQALPIDREALWLNRLLALALALMLGAYAAARDGARALDPARADGTMIGRWTRPRRMLVAA
ncbi:MAG: hypothetical protein AAF772_19365, partial [Acidobacteriota bacterium]